MSDETEQPIPKDLISVQEAARVFSVEPSNIRYWMATGTLASWRIGLGKGRRLISRAQLERLLEERNRIRPA